MPEGLTFTLADHPGYLHLDAPPYEIMELSAKPLGREFGIRADNKVLREQILEFLFLPQPAPRNG